MIRHGGKEHTHIIVIIIICLNDKTCGGKEHTHIIVIIIICLNDKTWREGTYTHYSDYHYLSQ